jgi:3-deoxy-D-manno-octulosonic-acid transferase
VVSACCANRLGRSTLAISGIVMKLRLGLRQRLALLAYQVCMMFVLPLIAAALFWRGFRQASYWQNLPQRLGYLDIVANAWGGILVHAASLGEVLAAQPLIDALLERYPARLLTVSCQTPTGLAQVHKQWGGRIRAVYLPVDTPGACRRFLSRVQPRLVILLERELWPTLMAQCDQRLIPVVLVNARLSDRSARQCQRLAWLMKPVLAQLSAIHAADQPSADRLIRCGASEQVVQYGGNLKFDIPVQRAWSQETVRALGALKNRVVMLLASSHEGEEAQVLDLWPDFLLRFPHALLVIVPRHPHRFEHVAQLIAQRGLRFVKRSQAAAIDTADQVMLVDAMGELQQWYRMATVCALGGSWTNVGGHNALEALLVGQAVLFGSHTQNFETLYADIERVGAGERTASVAQMMERAKQWLDQSTLMAQRSQNALTWVQSNLGSSTRAMAQIQDFLPPALAEIAVEKTDSITVYKNPQWLFDSEIPWQRSRTVPTTNTTTLPGGRAKVRLWRQSAWRLVIRHAQRGGLIGKILGDRFLRQASYCSRSVQEFQLLRVMHAWGLPVPQAVAARHEAGLCFYRCDLITLYMEDSVNLHSSLCLQPLSLESWQAIGRMVAQFHAHQIDHVDLNCHNILLLPADGAGKLYKPALIDFDKCQLRPGDKWKASNLSRLQRSLQKEKKLRPELHWQPEDWQGFITGYQSYSSAGLC